MTATRPGPGPGPNPNPNAVGCIKSYTPVGGAPAAAASTRAASTASLSLGLPQRNPRCMASTASLSGAGRAAAVVATPVVATPYTPYRCAPRHAKEAKGLLADAGAYLEDAEASRCAYYHSKYHSKYLLWLAGAPAVVSVEPWRTSRMLLAVLAVPVLAVPVLAVPVLYSLWLYSTC